MYVALFDVHNVLKLSYLKVVSIEELISPEYLVAGAIIQQYSVNNAMNSSFIPLI